MRGTHNEITQPPDLGSDSDSDSDSDVKGERSGDERRDPRIPSGQHPLTGVT